MLRRPDLSPIFSVIMFSYAIKSRTFLVQTWFLFLLSDYWCSNALTITSNVNNGELMVEGETLSYVVKYEGSGNTSANFTGGFVLLHTCVFIDNTEVAVVSDSNFSSFSVDTSVDRMFNFSVQAIFFGKTRLRLLHIFATDNRFLKAICTDNKNLHVQLVTDSYLLISQQEIGFAINGRDVVGYEQSFYVTVIRKQRVIDTIFIVVVISIIIVINLCLGCETKLEIIKAHLRRPLAPLIGFCSQFLIMPLLSFSAIKIFHLDPAIALGLFATGCSPGGAASNAYTSLLAGDTTLSITMTFVSTVFALGMIPLWLFILSREIYPDSDIIVPYQNIFYSLISLLIPVGIGLLIQHKRQTWAAKLIKMSKVIMIVFLVFVLTGGVYANLYIFKIISVPIVISAALLPTFGLLLGGVAAFACRQPWNHVITIAIETGIQNTGITVALLLISLPHPDSDLSIVAPIFVSIFTPLPLGMAIICRHLKQYYEKRRQFSLNLSQRSANSPPDGCMTMNDRDSSVSPNGSEGMLGVKADEK